MLYCIIFKNIQIILKIFILKTFLYKNLMKANTALTSLLTNRINTYHSYNIYAVAISDIFTDKIFFLNVTIKLNL